MLEDLPHVPSEVRRSAVLVLDELIPQSLLGAAGLGFDVVLPTFQLVVAPALVSVVRKPLEVLADVCASRVQSSCGF